MFDVNWISALEGVDLYENPFPLICKGPSKLGRSPPDEASRSA